jgi:transcriptional regulator with XRE-family HTH domain
VPKAKIQSGLARLVGRRICELREQRGWAQVDLAAHIDERAKQPTISAFENGRRFPSRATLEALATALDVEPAALMLDPNNPRHRAALAVLKCKDRELLRSVSRMLGSD